MEHRQLTLMFTDIVGYSRLMGRDETAAIELLGEYRRILLARIEEFHGTLIEFAGDAIFARFDCSIAAVQAAVAIQKDLGVFNRNRDKTLPLLQSRIGIHAGEVALRDNAVFGDDVNIAARLEPIAVADGVCVSGDVYKAVKDAIHEPVLSLGKQTLKNIESKIKVYLIRPAGITLGTHAHYFWRTCQLKLGTYRYPIAVSVLLLIAAGFYFIPRWLVPGYDANYVEIADFQNLMNDTGEADYFSAGITEALRAQLADMRDVYILDADEGVRAPVRLEGNVQRVGENLRIAYRLFRRKDNVQIAGGKLDGAYNDIFILQDRVVAEIAGYLAEEFDLRNFRPAALKLTSDVTAYDYYLQGLDYLKNQNSQDQFDEAIKMFSTALVHDPEFALANTGLCSAYMARYGLSKLELWILEAEKYCQLALKQNDRNSETYEALGRIYRDTGRYNEAITILQTAVEINPDNVGAIIKLARTYQLQNESSLAEQALLQAVEKQPKLWLTHHALATFYARTGQIKEAIKAYNVVLEITPENSTAYANLGTAYMIIGKFQQAAEAYEKSAQLTPKPRYFGQTGNLYFLSGNYQKSADMSQAAINMAPEDFWLYSGLADALRYIPGKSEEAKKNYFKVISLAQKSLELNPKNLVAYQHIVFSYLYLDQPEKAKMALKKAFEISEHDINNLYTKLVYLTLIGEYDTAITVMDELSNSGYTRIFIEAHPDLAPLINHPSYKSFLFAKNSDTQSQN